MRRILSTLWDTGFRLRCPVCEQGALFDGWFKMHALCPHCSVRFERYEGEVLGGMSLALSLTTFIFLVGFFTTEALFEWPLWLHLLIWLSFVTIFPILFYRYSRALWVVFLHFTGAVFWDHEPSTQNVKRET
ncbi:MAG: DUF983 domain-containing protein [Ardenticatenaceae bacterium]